eukprot:3047703-Prymnesium_polylepis.1
MQPFGTHTVCVRIQACQRAWSGRRLPASVFVWAMSRAGRRVCGGRGMGSIVAHAQVPVGQLRKRVYNTARLSFELRPPVIFFIGLAHTATTAAGRYEQILKVQAELRPL